MWFARALVRLVLGGSKIKSTQREKKRNKKRNIVSFSLVKWVWKGNRGCIYVCNHQESFDFPLGATWSLETGNIGRRIKQKDAPLVLCDDIIVASKNAGMSGCRVAPAEREAKPVEATKWRRGGWDAQQRERESITIDRICRRQPTRKTSTALNYIDAHGTRHQVERKDNTKTKEDRVDDENE
jgi:hypothetical protein